MHVAHALAALGLAIGCGGGTHATPDASSGGDGATDAGADVSDVQFVTSKGTFVLELHRSWAPHGVDRVHDLVDASFYDDARFFRVISGFVVQFGINGTPATNAMWSSQTIPDDPVVQSNTLGYVSFAQTSAPDSRTTQLFVNLADNSYLDAMNFAPIGVVTSGMDVVNAIDSEYGQAPDQSQIAAQGNAYLTANFPDLDYIETARFQ